MHGDTGTRAGLVGEIQACYSSGLATLASASQWSLDSATGNSARPLVGRKCISLHFSLACKEHHPFSPFLLASALHHFACSRALFDFRRPQVGGRQHSALEMKMSGPATDEKIGLLSLPEGARKQIFELVLKLRHPIFLFQDADTRVEAFAPERPRRWLALLYSSRRVYQEAAAVLYRRNTYYLLDEGMRGPELLRDFLDRIGDRQAEKLSHLCITFPTIHGALGSFELSSDGVGTLEQLRAKCSGLEILEAHLVGKPAVDLTDADRTMAEFTPEALAHLDRQVKSLPLMQRFIVRVYRGRPAARHMEAMQNFGWQVLPANRDRW